MRIAASGVIQALKNGRHNSPYAEGGAPEPAEYKGRVFVWFPSVGKRARFALKIEVTESGSVALVVRRQTKGFDAPLHTVLPKKPDWTKEEAALYELFQALMRPMFKEASSANQHGKTYAIVSFRTIWKIPRRKLSAVMSLFGDANETVH